MNADEVLLEARRWWAYALEDLTAAETAPANAAYVPRHACWLAQQAAEKALKAGLIFLQIEFPFTHDLDVLRNLLPSDWSVRARHTDLAELTEWAVGARYPGDAPDPNAADARKAVEQARGLVDSLEKDLFDHDFPLA